MDAAAWVLAGTGPAGEDGYINLRSEVMCYLARDDLWGFARSAGAMHRCAASARRPLCPPWPAHLVQRLALVDWALNSGWAWPEDACQLAAAAGSLEVLKRARADGCDWDADASALRRRRGHQGFWRGEGTSSAAAKGGHLDLLKWARGHGCPWDDSTCQAAAEGGHVALLK